MKRRPIAMPMEQWLLLNRQITDTDCWEWTRAHLRQGYGHVRTPGSGPILVHRLAYELWIGEIPDGLIVCHHCDNPPCFNPAHLYAGTNLDNARDCVNRGRKGVSPNAGHANRRRGEDQVTSKLTEADVRSIRQDTRAKARIAREYGVSSTTITRVQTREHWRHVA